MISFGHFVSEVKNLCLFPGNIFSHCDEQHSCFYPHLLGSLAAKAASAPIGGWSAVIENLSDAAILFTKVRMAVRSSFIHIRSTVTLFYSYSSHLSHGFFSGLQQW